MVACSTVCLRQLAQGRWAKQMQFWRFMANGRVTVGRLIEGWSDRTRDAAVGRHVLAIQDTSELRFSTTADNRRGLGKVKKGTAYGVLLHAMIGVDADSGAMLGLVGGQIWTRQGDVETPHAKRPLTDRKSTRLNSSHLVISYAVFCLKKKKKGARTIGQHGGSAKNKAPLL